MEKLGKLFFSRSLVCPTQLTSDNLSNANFVYFLVSVILFVNFNFSLFYALSGARGMPL